MLDQAVEHPRRVQVDIEIDGIELKSPASNFRGARRVAFVQRWWVMVSPTGQRFCVVRPQLDLEEHAPVAKRAGPSC